MSKILDEVLAANAGYAASFGAKGELALPPARGFAILTCMDARLDPARFAGLAEGDAHVIRNAGGRASDDAIRSLVISHKLLGTLEWFVIHHTDCGMELFTDETMGDLLAESLATATYGPEGWRNQEAAGGSPAGRYVSWLTIRDRRAASSTSLGPQGRADLRLRLRRQDRTARRDRGGRGGRPRGAVGRSERAGIRSRLGALTACGQRKGPRSPAALTCCRPSAGSIRSPCRPCRRPEASAAPSPSWASRPPWPRW